MYIHGPVPSLISGICWGPWNVSSMNKRDNYIYISTQGCRDEVLIMTAKSYQTFNRYCCTGQVFHMYYPTSILTRTSISDGYSEGVEKWWSKVNNLECLVWIRNDCSGDFPGRPGNLCN